jgi:hypothetical protein
MKKDNSGMFDYQTTGKLQFYIRQISGDNECEVLQNVLIIN